MDNWIEAHFTFPQGLLAVYFFVMLGILSLSLVVEP